MINWVLMVMICPSMQGGCIWERGYNGPIASEERCIAMGLQTDPANIRFKCVLIDSTLVDLPPKETRAAAKQAFEAAIPLPRPRPR
jgi:hypothetical protein